MIHITKNDDELDIKNVICFYVGENIPEPIEKVNKKKEEDWSYQDYLTSACSKMKFNLIWLNKRYVRFKFSKNNVIDIDDDFTNIHIAIKEENKKDTIIFQGQANDNPGINYETLMRSFESLGFFMLNTYDEIREASNKMLSANLLSVKKIPQPNYVLITKNIMQDEEGNTKQQFWDILETLYEHNSFIGNDTEIKYVVKILGGSLGIGVFLCNNYEIQAILETIFSISPEIELMVQEYKENTGDIRAHAFSIDGKTYEIIASMKRNKIEKDFRSNVSLGATTEKIDLSDKQKEIIVDTAIASRCRWVGVDLMDCKDGNSYVIEYNSSPGVQGISQQIKKNIFEIVLEKIQKYFKENSTAEDSFHEYKDTVTPYVKYDDTAINECKEIWKSLSSKRNKVMEKCLDYVPGTQYKLHGKNNKYEGLDCSGYVARVFKHSIGAEVPMMCAEYFIYREANSWKMIKEEELKPGDIGILNDTTKNNHIGIYAGNGRWFENSIVYGVQLTDYSKFKYFFKIKDIDNDD